MNNFFLFILLITTGSCLLYTAYVVIRNDSSPTFNRYFLLSCIVVPIVFSFITIRSSFSPSWLPAHSKIQIYSAEKSYVRKISPDSITSQTSKTAHSDGSSGSMDWWKTTQWCYQIVSCLLLLKTLFALLSIWRLKKSAHKIENPTPLWTVSQKGFTGASFFHLIFIHERFLSTPSFPFLIAHESIHRKRWHSLDLLIAEIYKALFWVNPIAWILVREIRINSELETDAYLSRNVNIYEYSRVLIELSAPSQSLQHSFSAFETKKRVTRLIKPIVPKPLLTILTLPFFALCFIIISCQPEVNIFASLNPDESLQGVKTITSIYISHQFDTQQKDGKTVAIAHYDPNGILERVEQFMTFPYDYPDPKIVSFYSEPSASGLTHIIDGLSLGKAENNLLYGPQWPKIYAESKKRETARRATDYTSYTTDISWNTSGLPKYVTVDENFKKNGYLEVYKQRVTELFEYASDKISNYSHQFTDIHTNEDSISLNLHLKDDASFFYEGEHLKEVHQGDNIYAFVYQGEFLTTTTYSIAGKIYNSRKYYYDEDGLKIKTEVLNVTGDPEYTILFEYEFYDL